MMLIACSDSSELVTKTCTITDRNAKYVVKGMAKGKKSEVDTIEFDITVQYDTIALDKEDINEESKEMISFQLKSLFAVGIDHEKVALTFHDTEAVLSFSQQAKEWADTVNAEAAIANIDTFVEKSEEDGLTCQ